MPELLFAAVLVWLFATGQGWTVLLADGDTGWHIRNGEQIIDSHAVPRSDPFSFASEGHSWFAWEWLSDVLFAALFRKGGLPAVAVCCGIVIAAYISVLFRHIVSRSIGVSIALPLTLLAAGASSVHYLARPHVIGLFLFAIVAWLIDRDRIAPGRMIWILPLLFLPWANCHGSFLAGLAMLGLRLVETALQDWKNAPFVGRKRLPRMAILFGFSSGVTLCNPYGWHLHAHAVEYLRSAWIQATIEEFQSPRFRSENMFQYEILLVAGLCALPWLARRKEVYPCCVVVFWAHESLASVRHVPLYCLAACPFAASWLQSVWDARLRYSRPDALLRTLNSIHLEWQPWTTGFTIWPLVLCLGVGFTADRQASAGVPIGFPSNKFPIGLIERNLPRFTSTFRAPRRVFSSDQWSDYVIFRCYPGARVFFDGRSDFFGPWRGSTYQELMRGSSNSSAILDREKVELALVPADWALSGILRNSPQWRVADSDEQAVLFERQPGKLQAALIKNPLTADKCAE